MKPIIVLTTVETKKEASELAKQIIQEKLGACVQINEIKSIYKWKGKLEEAKEFRLMIKTSDSKYLEIEKFIKKNSKYDLPEVVAVNIVDGSDDYLNWVYDNLK